MTETIEVTSLGALLADAKLKLTKEEMQAAQKAYRKATEEEDKRLDEEAVDNPNHSHIRRSGPRAKL